MEKSVRKIFKVLVQLLVLTILMLFGWSFLLNSHSTESIALEVVVCDVGQGDAILLRYDQLVILLDVGPNSAILTCLQAELPFWKKTIDLLVLTHADQDHIGGFSDLVKQYEVKSLFVNPKEKNTAAAQAVEAWKQKTGRYHSPLGGEIIAAPGFRLEVLWSEHQRAVRQPKAAQDEEFNSDSIAVAVTTQSFGFLSFGDLECDQELAVNSTRVLSFYHLLKMSHHGAKTSSCLPFLERIAPEAAFYSAGSGNKYGHPAAETLENAAIQGIPVVGTDTFGRMRFQRKAGKLQMRAERGGRISSQDRVKAE